MFYYFRIYFLSFFCFLLASCGTSSSPSSSLEDFRIDGENIGLIIEKNPENADAYNLRGISYARSGELDKALSDFDRAVDLKNNFYQAYYNRGLVFFKLKNYQAALGDFEKTIEIKSDYPEAYLARARLFLVRKRFGSAMKDLDRTTEVSPDHAEAYFIKGLIYQKQKKHAKAYQEFSSAVALGYVNKKSIYHRVLSGLELEYYSEVIEDLQSWIFIDRKNHKAHALAGFAYEKDRNYKNAQNEFEIALKIKPGYEFAKRGLERVKRKNILYYYRQSKS